MKLCFGVFANILRHCSKKFNQEKLVANLVRCVDSQSSYIESEYRYSDESKEVEGDKPAISKLMNCKKNFFFSGGQTFDIPELDMVVKNLNAHIIPAIEDKGKIKFILALIRVVGLDSSIDIEEKEIFKKIFGGSKKQFLEQGEYVFSDVLGRTLLYTVNSEIENSKGADCVKEITNSYIEKEFTFFCYDYEWDSNKASLKFFPYKIYNLFNEILLKHNIKKLVEEIDPTCFIDLSEWIENGEGFVEDIAKQITDQYSKESPLLLEIQKFSKVLSDYLDYLCLNMRPADSNTSMSVPIYRDENVQLSMIFEKTVTDFRLELIDVYKKIFNLVMRMGNE